MNKLLKNILALVGCLAALAAIALVLKKFFCKKKCECENCDDVEDFVEQATEQVEDAVEEAKEKVEEKAEAVAEEFKDYADVELPKEE